MIYINKFLKPLLTLLVVLALHALVFWQVVQHAPEKRIVQPPKPIMVSLITPPKPPVAKKTLVKKTEIKTIAKPKRKWTKKAKPPKKVKRKRAKKVKRTKKVKWKRTKKVKPHRKIAKLSKRSKPTIQKKVAARSKRSAKSTTTTTNYQASRSYQVRQNSKKSGRTNQASSRRRKKVVSVITTAPSYKAAYLHNPHPPYPRISRRRGEQGKILLRVKVSKNGKPTSVIIKKSSGTKRLDKAARQAVNKWRFIPAKTNGKPISGWVIVPIVFKLN